MAAAMDAQPVKRLAMKPEGFRPIYSIVIGVLSIVLLFVGLRFTQASNAAWEAKALESSNSFEQRQAAYNKDLNLRPTHIDSIVGLSSMYYQVYKQTKREEFYTGGMTIVDLGLQAEPYNRNMLFIKMRLEQAKGNNDKAFAILENNRANFTWDLDWYNLLITQAFEFGNKARLAKDSAKEQKYFQAGLAAYQQVLDGVVHLKTIPPEIQLTRTFEVTPSIALSAGKIEFMSGKPAEAAIILKNGLKDDLSDATNREVTRYYIAALQKQGQDDKALYDKLIQANPKEKELINELKRE